MTTRTMLPQGCEEGITALLGDRFNKRHTGGRENKRDPFGFGSTGNSRRWVRERATIGCGLRHWGLGAFS